MFELHGYALNIEDLILICLVTVIGLVLFGSKQSLYLFVILLQSLSLYHSDAITIFVNILEYKKISWVCSIVNSNSKVLTC